MASQAFQSLFHIYIPSPSSLTISQIETQNIFSLLKISSLSCWFQSMASQILRRIVGSHTTTPTLLRQLSTTTPITATLFPGDGIGPEIAESVKQVYFRLINFHRFNFIRIFSIIISNFLFFVHNFDCANCLFLILFFGRRSWFRSYNQLIWIQANSLVEIRLIYMFFLLEISQSQLGWISNYYFFNFYSYTQNSLICESAFLINWWLCIG